MSSFRLIDVPPGNFPEAPDAGAAPILQWIKISNLVVDDTYQRELKRENWSAIRRIAERFRWSRFSTVFVAPVEGGRFAIIDAQHRTHAAALCGFEEVPCQIVQMDPGEQAASFAAVNGLVTKVTSWNILKAALAAGESWALDCAKVCADAGCRLMLGNNATDAKKPGEIYAIRLIRDAVKRGKGSAARLTLSGIRRSEFGEQATAYSNEILKPAFSAVADRPWLVKGKVDLASFFDEFDIWQALDEAEEIAKKKRRSGATGISRYDLAAAFIGEGLDKAFPQRMALPAPPATEQARP
jgi:hypothetical protein